MRLKTLKNLKLKGKKVLLRCGFDVPFDEKGRIKDDERIKQSLPTIKHLIKNKAVIIIISHNGRPDGKVVKNLSMDQVGKRLSKLLLRKVIKFNDCQSEKVCLECNKLAPSEVALLENLRFCKEEEKNDLKFAKGLADLADIYINDAFSNSHRAHASMTGIPKYLPSYAGFLVEKEVRLLSQILDKPKRPFVAVVGGAKIKGKLDVISSLIKRVDFLLLGGALTNTVLSAQGIQVGRSKIEYKMIAQVKKLNLTDLKLKIPVDVVVAKDISPQAKAYVKPIGGIDAKDIILDIGPDTVYLFKSVIKEASQIVWAGPMGMFEIKKFASGCNEIGRAIAQSPAKTVVGGGDTVSILESLSLKDKIDFISTGGGAMLKFLEGKILPALKPLIKK